MSILFKDKVYDNMNWLEMACRPIIEPLNEILSSFPEKIEITKEMIVSHRQVGYTTAGSILIFQMKINHPYLKLSYSDKELIKACFEFKVCGDEEVYYDSATDTMSGMTINLIKIKEFFEEKETENRIGQGTIRDIRQISYKSVQAPYANEMLELFSLDEARRSRSKKVKVRAIADKIAEIMHSNQWNIRDLNLSNRFGKWMCEYLCTGNLAALANICKLKAMVHLDEPIYSMEEEEL